MKTLYIVVILVLLQHIHVCQDPELEQLKVNPLDFVFNGQCPEQYTDCMPYADLSFRFELKSHSDSEILKRINDFIKNNPDFFIKPLEVYKIDKKTRNFGIRTLDSLKKREGYMNISFDYVISNDDINYKVMFPNLTHSDKLPKLPTFERSYATLGGKTNFHPDTFRFITNFLFHMYHLNESYIHDSLLGLPLDFKDSPLFSMIPPEYTLFKELDVGVTTVMFRKDIKDAYEYYTNFLKKTWTQDERNLFFNNHEIILDDFVYAFFIMRTRGLPFIKERKIILIPINCFAQNFEEARDNDERSITSFITDFNYKLHFNKETNHTDSLTVLTDRALEKNENILLNFKSSSNLEFFLLLGMIPKQNPNECFDHEFLNKQDLQDLKLTVPNCARIKDLKRLYLINNIMNMNEGQILICKAKLNKIEWNSEEFYTECDNECAHPKWIKKKDIWINAINHLEENIERLETMKTSAMELIFYRNRKNLPTSNVDLIKNFFESRIKLYQEFMDQIKELKKYQKRKIKEKKVKSEL